MTHPEYLEQFHEITVQTLPEISLALAKGETDYGGQLLTALNAAQATLWDQRQITAAQEVDRG